MGDNSDRKRTVERMTVDAAIRRALEEFPFQGYMRPEPAARGPYSNVANTVLRHLRPGSTILDFGCGPCDKTAVLQFLGFDCAGYDDLQDEWHKSPGVRDRILAFANKCGIDFRQATAGALPFDKHSFDMVMLQDIVEHLHDSPRLLLNDLLELVKPNGLLFVTVPNAVNIRKRIDVLFGRTNLPPFDSFYWDPGSWRGHVREYVRNDLARLAEYLDLDVLELRGCDHMLEKVPRSLLPAYLLVTRSLRGWKDSWLLVARKKQNWSPKRTVPRDKLARNLGRTPAYDSPPRSTEESA
jgi:2-polyprenyl-3-methyl-5-hydroxy-6-metoxy-1,4-benzoquinol methylase